MSTLDIVLIVVAALCIIIGLSKGVLKQLFSIGSLILAIVASYFLCSPVCNFAMEKSIGTFQPYTAVEEKVTEIAVNKLGEGINEIITAETVEAQIQEALTGMGLPGLLSGPVYNAFADQITEIEGKTLGDLFIPLLSGFVLKIICYVLIFVVAFILLKIVFALISKLLDIGVFKFVDRLVGAAIGLVIALLIANVLMVGLSFLAGVIPAVSEFIAKDIASSMGVARYFYDNNWISYLMANSFDFEGLLNQIMGSLNELK